MLPTEYYPKRSKALLDRAENLSHTRLQGFSIDNKRVPISDPKPPLYPVNEG